MTTAAITVPSDALYPLREHLADLLLPLGYVATDAQSTGVAGAPDVVAFTIYARPRTDGARIVECFVCQDCGAAYESANQLHPLENPAERLSPGDRYPDGQCPDVECGAVCHREYTVLGGTQHDAGDANADHEAR